VCGSALEFMKERNDREDRCDARNAARGSLYQLAMCRGTK
jgi:hypothetical protein